MPLRTRLTERFGIEHPILSAPMGYVGGGKLAAAVSHAGGLGLIGGGYGDTDWLEREFAEAGNARVGCGFITWALAEKPALLDAVLARAPAALMLSFGTIAPFAARIRQAGVPLICQVQTMAHAREAVAAGAAVIVAQGGEAGGHGGSRATLTLVPEVADHLAHAAPDTLLVAAGGIADGRGLAAALMLGADGVLIGSRLVASRECLVPPGFHDAIVAADGDATVKTTVIDVVRELPLAVRVHGPVAADRLRHGVASTRGGAGGSLDAARTRANATGRPSARAIRTNTGVFAGEAAGLIHDVQPAGRIVESMVEQAERLLAAGASQFVRAAR